jgi:hypothetical protein
MRSAFRPLNDILLLLIAGVLTLVYVSAAGGGFPLDDSWIHQTYARNLAQTGQWAFVPGVPSAASTSPLYTVVLALGYALNVPLALWTHGIGALALALTGIVGCRLGEIAAARFLTRRQGIGLLTGLALVLAWHLIWAGASGMETMIFCLLTLVLIWWVWRRLVDDLPRAPPLPDGAIFGVLAGLTTLARPEGAMLVGMVGAAMLIARPGMTWRQVIAWGSASAVAFVLTMLPYLLFNLSVTDGLLPNTAAAKQAWAAPVLALAFSWRLQILVEPLLAGAQSLLLPGLAVFALLALAQRERRTALWLLPLLWSAGLIVLYAARLPLPFQHGRYVIPALPAWIVVGVIGSAWLYHQALRSMIGRIFGRTLALSCAALFVLFALTIGRETYRRDVAIIDQEMVTAAFWVRDNLPPEELLAVHDIGALGYFAPRPILDIAGLVTPEVIPIILDGDALWALMEARGARYLMAMDDQVPNDNPADPRLCPLFDTQGALAPVSGGSNVMVYRLAWDRVCS